MRKILPLLFFIASGIALHAQEDAPEHPIDAALGECLSIDSNQSTYGMIGCLQTAQESWDAEMNRVYKGLMERLDSTGQEALRAAQRTWLKYRDAEIELCGALFYGNLDGTMYRVMAAERVTGIVRTRAMELQSYLDILSE